MRRKCGRQEGGLVSIIIISSSSIVICVYKYIHIIIVHIYLYIVIFNIFAQMWPFDASSGFLSGVFWLLAVVPR